MAYLVYPGGWSEGWGSDAVDCFMWNKFHSVFHAVARVQAGRESCTWPVQCGQVVCVAGSGRRKKEVLGVLQLLLQLR